MSSGRLRLGRPNPLPVRRQRLGRGGRPPLGRPPRRGRGRRPPFGRPPRPGRGRRPPFGRPPRRGRGRRPPFGRPPRRGRGRRPPLGRPPRRGRGRRPPLGRPPRRGFRSFRRCCGNRVPAREDVSSRRASSDRTPRRRPPHRQCAAMPHNRLYRLPCRRVLDRPLVHRASIPIRRAGTVDADGPQARRTGLDDEIGTSECVGVVTDALAPGTGPERRRAGTCPMSPCARSDHGSGSSPEEACRDITLDADSACGRRRLSPGDGVAVCLNRVATADTVPSVDIPGSEGRWGVLSTPC